MMQVTPEMLDAAPKGVIYGRSFRQTHLDGSVSTWGGTGYHTQEQCDRETFEYAFNIGWTLPKWWQFWRWNDYPRELPPGISSHPTLPSTADRTGDK